MAQTETVDYERLWTDRWGGAQDLGPEHRHIRRIIVETVRPLGVRSVVDVGCGNGGLLADLQQQLGLIDVCGIDISRRALEAAKQRAQGEFRVVDIARERLDRTFDLVLSSQVIEHIEDDDAMLARMRAMCGGYCLVGTLQGTMRPSERSIGHLRNYTRRGLEEKMERAGFAVERVIEWGFPFYSPLYRSVMEWRGVKAGTPGYDRRQRIMASLIYQLFRLNSSTRGDVLMILARAGDPQGSS